MLLAINFAVQLSWQVAERIHFDFEVCHVVSNTGVAEQLKARNMSSRQPIIMPQTRQVLQSELRGSPQLLWDAAERRP